MKEDKEMIESMVKDIQAARINKFKKEFLEDISKNSNYNIILVSANLSALEFYINVLKLILTEDIPEFAEIYNSHMKLFKDPESIIKENNRLKNLDKSDFKRMFG